MTTTNRTDGGIDDSNDGGSGGPPGDLGSGSGADEPPDDRTDEEISREEADDLIEEIERRRSLRGPAAIAVAIIGIAFSVFQLFLAARSYTFTIWLPTVDIAGISIAPWQVSLPAPAGERDPRRLRARAHLPTVPGEHRRRDGHAEFRSDRPGGVAAPRRPESCHAGARRRSDGGALGVPSTPTASG